MLLVWVDGWPRRRPDNIVWAAKLQEAVESAHDAHRASIASIPCCLLSPGESSTLFSLSLNQIAILRVTKQSAVMLPVQRRFLILEHGIGTALITAALNGAIAWLIFCDSETVPFWGLKSIAGDLVCTTFLLPLLLCLISTPLARREVRRGRIPPLRRRREDHWYLRWLPIRARMRGLALGTMCALVLSPMALFTLAALEVTSMDLWTFVVGKAVLNGVLAGLLGPLVGLWGIVRLDESTESIDGDTAKKCASGDDSGV